MAFIAKDSGGKPVAGSDAAAVSFFDPKNLPCDLAFDHGEILRDYLSLVLSESPEER